jgi:hypothetical protein
MEKEIYIDDGIGGEHRVKYLDENRVIVQKVTRWNDLAIGELERFSMPGKVKLHDMDTWPFTEKLKAEIRTFHSNASE